VFEDKVMCTKEIDGVYTIKFGYCVAMAEILHTPSGHIYKQTKTFLGSLNN